MPTKPIVWCSWTYPEAGLSLLRDTAEVRVYPGPGCAPRAELLQQLPQAAAVFACPPTDRLDAEAMDLAPNLKVISGFGVGYDYVQVPEATKRGILVCNTPGTLTETMADYTFALMLATARRTAEGDRFMRTRAWSTYQPDLLLGAEINGATLGIVGLGAIGAGVARRATGFDMKILYHSRSRKPEIEASTGAELRSLDDVLRESDFVCLTTALTPETRGLIGERELNLMKRSAILINTARGAVTDELALAAALKSGRIAGAGIDVYTQEPLPADHPLLDCETALLMPHVGSGTHATRARMSVVACDNIKAVLQGDRPRFLINPEAWEKRRP
ncbi:MAG TPA: D-glycerate dehydrogenase [Chloroflexota bacterium]|nr:D-glycerate dehydrogenase [Chloroflexota bacterium]